MSKEKSAGYLEKLEAVKKDGTLLDSVPEDIIDKEMCLAAVRQNGAALRYVPEKQKDRNLCHVAVSNWGYALEDVPDDFVDNAMCLVAVSQNGMALRYVPDDLMSPEICMTAMETADNPDVVRDFIPSHFLDEEGNLLSREEMDQIWAEVHPEDDSLVPGQ